MMDKDSKIFVAGHTGLFGSTTVKYLKQKGYNNLILKTHSELDLTIQKDTQDFFREENPEYVFVMYGMVGGIQANNERMAEFAMENIKMSINIIDCAHSRKIKKLLYVGSSCIYPTNSMQPIKEEYILESGLEPTNEGYALAKIMGIKLCKYYQKQYGDNFISCIPANVYGPCDNFDEEKNHVIPALIKRFHKAKESQSEQVEIWGSGKPKREFLYIWDAVEACVFLMNQYNHQDTINVGVGTPSTIAELAKTIAKVTGYRGSLFFDTTKPDGMMERMLDSSKINEMGWQAKTKLEDGLKKTYSWFLDNKEKL